LFCGKSIFFVTLISIIGRQLPSFLLLFLSAHGLAAGLGSFLTWLLAILLSSPRNGVRVTYLGTTVTNSNSKGTPCLLILTFSRVDLLSVALGSRIQPNAARINDGLRHLASGNCRTDAIWLTHGHFDHLLDVPAVMAKTGRVFIASAVQCRSCPAAAGRGRFHRRRT